MKSDFVYVDSVIKLSITSFQVVQSFRIYFWHSIRLPSYSLKIPNYYGFRRHEKKDEFEKFVARLSSKAIATNIFALLYLLMNIYHHSGGKKRLKGFSLDKALNFVNLLQRYQNL